MKVFILKLLLFAGIIFLVDLICYQLILCLRPVDYAAFLKSKEDFFKEKGTYDVLVFGDSHAADGIWPEKLDSEYGLSTYNLAVYYASPFEVYYLTRNALKHLPAMPSLVLLGASPAMFFRPITRGKYTRIIMNDFTEIMNLYKESEEGIDSGFFLRSAQEIYILKYFLVRTISNRKYQPIREVVSVENGFLEFTNNDPGLTWGDLTSAEAEWGLLNENQVEYFYKTIELLKQKGISVIIVNLPVWRDYLERIETKPHYVESARALEKISKDTQIPIFNPGHNQMNDELDASDFLNYEHLNSNGAAKFTEILGEYLVDSFRPVHRKP